MKSEHYYLISEAIRTNVINRINEMPIGKSIKVVISNAGSKSDKQRRLQWLWYTELSVAGVGGKHFAAKEI